MRQVRRHRLSNKNPRFPPSQLRMQPAAGGRKTWSAAGSIQLKETEGARTEALGAQVDHGWVCVRVHAGGM